MKHFIFKILPVLGIICLAVLAVNAQKSTAPVQIKDILLDESGKPVQQAIVWFDNGTKMAIPDETGTFTVNTSLSDILVIEAEDFETLRLNGATLQTSLPVTMTKLPIGLRTRDLVKVPFGQLHARQLTGAATAIHPELIRKSDKTENVKGIFTGRVPGMFGNNNSRSNTDVYSGLLNEGGNMVMVVDGIPRTGDNLNLSEVESITVLRDITTRALYGAQAMDGVILITTKRGQSGKRIMNLSLEHGIAKPVSLPEFMNAGDYMTFYNQALANDGLPAKYTEVAIAKTRSGEDPVKYPDASYYNDTYLKDFGNFTHLIGEVSGGNSNAQYYLNLGWKNSSDLLNKLWKEKYNDGRNSFHLRGNVDYRINDFITMKIDGVAFFETDQTPRFKSEGNTAQTFYTRASSFLPNYYPLLIEASLLSPDQQTAAKLINGKYVPGGTSEYQTNIYGELATNGYYTGTTRMLQNNTALNFDLGSITQGLSATANLTFDMTNSFGKSLNRTYAVYQPTYTIPSGQTAEVLTFTRYGVDKPAETPSVSNVSYYRRIGLYATLGYDRIFNGKHHLNATGVSYYNYHSLSGELQNEKTANIGLRINYMLSNRYVAEINLVTSGSAKLDNAKWGTSPAAGVVWIASEENFLKNSSVINYLKLRANAGILKTDQYSAFRQYMNYYTGGANADYYYYGFGANRNYRRTINAGNPGIDWTERQEVSAGFETQLLENKLTMEGTWFSNKQSGIPLRLSNIYPAYVESTWQNYGEYTDKGVEWGLKYRLNLGKALLTLGHTGVWSTPTRVQDNVIDYAEPWRKRTGIATDAIFGLEDEGFYAASDFEANGNLKTGLPFPVYGEVKPGDIRYKDQNSDGFISEKDEKMIGNSSARLQYGLTLNLKAGDFELFVLGTGQTGAEKIYSKAYYWVYGDRKYPEEVRNAWTEATAATATYPRLTSKNNANNFRNSTFWMRNENYFSIHTAQLTWNLPFAAAQKTGLNGMQVYLRGSNLMMFAPNKERKQLNTDTAPQMRYFSLGISANF